MGNFPGPGKGFNTNEGVQPKAIKAMVDKLMADRDTTTYDYTSNNILDRSDSVNTLIGFYNGWFVQFPNIWATLFITVLVWYPLNYEHFGHCSVCFFTLIGWVEESEPWLSR